MLVMLLAAVLGLAPLWNGPTSDTSHQSDSHRSHVHVHEHDGVRHVHHHSHGEPGDESEDHHRVVDETPDRVEIAWTAPRRSEIDPPPLVAMSVAMVEGVANSLRFPPQAQPPPERGFHHQLKSAYRIRTVILLV